MAQIKIQHKDSDVTIPVWVASLIFSLIVGIFLYGFNLTLDTLRAKDSENENKIAAVLKTHEKDTGDAAKQLTVLSRNVLALCLTVKAPCEKEPIVDSASQNAELTLQPQK